MMPQQGKFTLEDIAQANPSQAGRYSIADVVPHPEPAQDSIEANDKKWYESIHGPGTWDTRKHTPYSSASEGPELIHNLAGYVDTSAGDIARGTKDIVHGDIAKGGHQVISGAMTGLAPVTPFVAAGAPVAFARAAAGGYLTGKLSETATKAAGGNEDQQAFANDLGNLGGGFAAGSGLPRALLETPIKELAAKHGAATLLDVLEAEHPTALIRKTLAGKVRAALENTGTTEGTTSGPVPADSGPAPAPYRMSGDQIPDSRTATPKRILPPSRQLPAYSPEPEVAPVTPSSSSPYRMSGDRIIDAKTVTPRRVLGPERQLPAAPEEAPAAKPASPPPTSQVLKDSGVTQAMKDAGIAAPSASARAVRPGTTAQLTPRADLTIPPGLTGEDAALMQLTRQNINELRFIAQKRGLPIGKDPRATHSDLIGKIHESLTPDEVSGFTAAAQASKVVPSQFPENNLMAKNLNDAASQLQAAKGSPYEIASLRNAANTIQQYPKALSEVDLSTTKIRGIDKRIGKRINDFLQQQKAVPVDDQVQTTTGQPMSMYEAMRQSLMQRGIKPPL